MSKFIILHHYEAETYINPAHIVYMYAVDNYTVIWTTNNHDIYVDETISEIMNRINHDS